MFAQNRGRAGHNLTSSTGALARQNKKERLRALSTHGDPIPLGREPMEDRAYTLMTLLQPRCTRYDMREVSRRTDGYVGEPNLSRLFAPIIFWNTAVFPVRVLILAMRYFP